MFDSVQIDAIEEFDAEQPALKREKECEIYL